jgi:hypothetical protein
MGVRDLDRNGVGHGREFVEGIKMLSGAEGKKYE